MNMGGWAVWLWMTVKSHFSLFQINFLSRSWMRGLKTLVFYCSPPLGCNGACPRFFTAIIQPWTSAGPFKTETSDQIRNTKPAVKLLKLLSSHFLPESKLAYYPSGNKQPRAALNATFPLLSPPQKSEIGWNSIFTVTAATAALLMMTSLLRTLVRCWPEGHQLHWDRRLLQSHPHLLPPCP